MPVFVWMYQPVWAQGGSGCIHQKRMHRSSQFTTSLDIYRAFGALSSCDIRGDSHAARSTSCATIDRHQAGASSVTPRPVHCTDSVSDMIDVTVYTAVGLHALRRDNAYR